MDPNLDLVGINNDVKNEDDNEESQIFDLREEFGKLILPFHFTSTASLIDVMMLSESVISGAAALALIHPGMFTPNHLDFLVPSKGAGWLILHLENHGYRSNPTFASDQDDYDRNTLVVLSLTHPVSDKSINIIIFTETHFVDHITEFHSTLVMNYIAWYGLVSLYPEWTTNRKGLITKSSAKTRITFKKHRDRGFTLENDNGALMEIPSVHVCKAGYDCPRTRRSLLDEECAFQPFEEVEHDLAHYEPPINWTLFTSCKFSGKSRRKN